MRLLASTLILFSEVCRRKSSLTQTESLTQQGKIIGEIG